MPTTRPPSGVVLTLRDEHGRGPRERPPVRRDEAPAFRVDGAAAELAVINEIGAALVEQLDFDAIIELVGERVRQLFDARSIFIALHDPVTT